jgi:DNA-binding NarL/FixJ family response regulator
MGLLRQACELENLANGPGLVLLAADGAVAGTNQAAGLWLEALGGRADGSDLPVEITALATRLRHLDASQRLQRLRVRLRRGGWAVLHASWMDAEVAGQIAVIIEAAPAAEIAPMIMTAFGLSDRERAVAGLVCQGLPTRVIAGHLHVTVDTVQDHLKSVFDKTGVRSRGALVATILHRDYLHNAGGPVTRPAA